MLLRNVLSHKNPQMQRCVDFDRFVVMKHWKIKWLQQTSPHASLQGTATWVILWDDPNAAVRVFWKFYYDSFYSFLRNRHRYEFGVWKARTSAQSYWWQSEIMTVDRVQFHRNNRKYVRPLWQMNGSFPPQFVHVVHIRFWSVSMAIQDLLRMDVGLSRLNVVTFTGVYSSSLTPAQY